MYYTTLEINWKKMGLSSIYNICILLNFQNDRGRQLKVVLHSLKGCYFTLRSFAGSKAGCVSGSVKKSREFNEFGTVSLWTLLLPLNSGKSNSENWTQSRYQGGKLGPL